MDYPELFYGSLMMARTVEEREHKKLALHAIAVQRSDAGLFEEAEEIYLKLLAQDGENAAWLHELGMLHLKQGKLQAAIAAVLQSLKLDPSVADRHFDFGTILEHSGPLQNPPREYLDLLGLEGESLTVDASDPEAGRPQVLLGEGEASAPSSIGAIADPAEASSNRGHLFLAQHRISEAVEAYEAALGSRPNDSQIASNLAFSLRLRGEHGRASILLGHTLFCEGRYLEAICEFERGLAWEQDDADAYLELAEALNRLRKHGRAIEVCKIGSQRYPQVPGFYREWVWALQHTGKPKQAIERAMAGAEALEDPTFLAHERYLSLPVVYQSEEEITEYRSRFSDGLRRLAVDISEATGEAVTRLRDGIRPNFFLGYQGLNDLPLQQRYGEAIHRIMRGSHPEWADARSMPPLNPDGRIRVGYISSFMRFHTVGKLFHGWLRYHDADRFEIISYHIGRKADLLTRQFETASDQFRSPIRDLETISEQILNDRLHILVFLDIGMDPLTSQLAGLRLAPIQCAAWGHPITTGLPTIDYFISSELMEPEDAHSHYSETLIRLPGVGVCVPRPYLPARPRSRREFGLPEDAVIYFSAQSEFKYLPQNDSVFAAIAARVPDALFLFIERRVPEVTEALRSRICSGFRQAGLDGEEYLMVLPQQDYLDFIDLNRICDVFLDTFAWSGGMTTLEAVGCSLPVVTCPGEFMRGRHSSAILRQMGILDTIATSIDDYIEIAVQLGLDGDWRQEMGQMIAERHDRLFDDQKCLEGLEDFFSRAVLDRLRQD